MLAVMGFLLRACSAACLAVLSLAGCNRSSEFLCTQDAQCTDGTNAGVCQSTGYCSFPDVACASGQRYGDRAPPELAGRCLPPDQATTFGPDDGSGGGSGGSGTGGDAQCGDGVQQGDEACDGADLGGRTCTSSP